MRQAFRPALRPAFRPTFRRTDTDDDPTPTQLRLAIAAEYAGQEESGPLLRTWGSEYLANITAFNNPTFDSDGPGELTARNCQRHWGDDISTYFVASGTDLFDLRTGPIDFWLRHSRPNTQRHIGSADPTLGIGQDAQWQVLTHSLFSRLFIDTGDGIAAYEAPLTADTDWHRCYLEYTDGVLIMRWGGYDWTIEAEELIGDASRVLIGHGPALTNNVNSYYALIRKWHRPLTEAEHIWLDSNPVVAAEMTA